MNPMNKRLYPVFALVLFGSAMNFVAAANDKPQTWKGVVTLVCTAPPPAQAAAAAGDPCRYSLFTPGDKKLYVLNPQDQAAKFAKKTVTVTGTIASAPKTKIATNDGIVEASTIQVAAIAPVPGS
jgi:hypothetical protein